MGQVELEYCFKTCQKTGQYSSSLKTFISNCV